MKQIQVKKRLPLGPQQFVIQLANSLQLCPHFLVILQPLLHLRLLFVPDTELPCASSGIADRQNPDAVAFSAPTLRTTPAMKDLPVQQRPPHDSEASGSWRTS